MFDEATKKISMPPGDTGDLYLEIEWDTNGKDAAALFAVVNANGKDLMIKAAEIVDGRAHIRLCNHDTRDLKPGTYAWQLRLVTSPARDEEGNIIADECTDDVISVFSGEEMPEFVLEKKGARV
jgi:hypothetical protein